MTLDDQFLFDVKGLKIEYSRSMVEGTFAIGDLVEVMLNLRCVISHHSLLDIEGRYLI